MSDNSKINLKAQKSEAVFLFLLKIFSGILLIILVAYHYKLLIHPFPAEIREGGELLTIKALSENINPFALSNQPFYFNLYGIVYPTIGAQLATIFGTTLFTGRLLGAIAICFSLILFFIVLRKEKINFWHCIFGVLIFYTNILFFVTPLNRPDSLGMLFFVLSISLPVIYRFNYLSLFAGMLFCILSFYTKQYFILGYLILILYLFLFKSIRKASVLFISFLVVFIVSAIWITKLYECFFYNTMLSLLLTSSNVHLYSIRQFLTFFATNLGLTLMMITSAVMLLFFKPGFRESRANKIGNIRNQFQGIIKNLNWNKGLFNFDLHPYAFLFSCILLCLVLILGGNVGAYMTYYYQLLSFPFIFLILRLPINYPKYLFYLFVAINFIASGSQYMIKSDYSNSDNDKWKKIDNMISSSENIFSTEEVSSLLIQHGKVPYYSGYTDGFFAISVSRKINSIFSFTKKLKEKDENFNQLIRENIKNKRFDVLILNERYLSSNDSMVSSTYNIHETIDVNFYHTQQKVKLYVWVPKPL